MPSRVPSAPLTVPARAFAGTRSCRRSTAPPATRPPVIPLMIAAVQSAVRAASLTDGAVDPTLGTAIAALGYDRDFDLGLAGRGSARAELSAPSADWRTIRVDAAAGTVAHRPGREPRPRRDREGARRRSRCKRRARGRGVRRPRQPGRGHRDRRSGAGRGMACPRDRRSSGRRRRSGSVDHAPYRRPGDVEHDRARVARSGRRRWCTTCSTPRPAYPWMAAGERRASRPPAAWTRTSRAPPRSCGVRARRRGSRHCGLPSRLVSDDGVAFHLCGWPDDGDDLASARLAEASA